MKQYLNINPITGLDYPDPDVIRVGDTYYMITTTMYFMPGGEILRSYDLVHWEHAAYVYDTLDSTPEQTLSGKENAYGKGMWAASIRYHKGCFYVCFVANDTQKTYLFTSKDIRGPWKKNLVEGFYHDCSLLFDDDDKVYIVSGNKYIRLVQLKADLSGPLEGGINRIIVSDADNPGLGYEGAHFYKINGRYYLFFIHSLRERWRRVEACFVADSLEGEFIGGDILNDDRGYCDQGVAQGGIVDTPDGRWYAMLFQDHGASGRIPILIPITWVEGIPVFGIDGRIPESFPVVDNRPNYRYQPLVQSDDFKAPLMTGELLKEQYGCFGLKSMWQFNHEPDMSLTHWEPDKGIFGVETGKICTNLTQAKNILTQRMLYPGCTGEVTVDGSMLKDGDYAGICALQGCYGMVALTKRNGQNFIVMMNKEADNSSLQAMKTDDEAGREWEAVMTKENTLRLKVTVDFTEMKDEARFFYHNGDDWSAIGKVHKLYFKMDHFTGCRFGLFIYSTSQIGGRADFSHFIYECNNFIG